MGKLWRWEMVGIWNIAGFHDAYLSFLWASQLLFFFNGCLFYDAFFEVLNKSLKGEKVFLNAQNIRADNLIC